jgi:outer membrane protein assembly factor BamB
MLFVRGQALTAIDGRTGNQLWSLRADGCSPVTLADGKLYLMEGANGVFAVDPATGATLWRNGDLASCSGLAVSGRMGYVRTTDGVLHAIRLMDDPARAKEQQADCRKDARRVVQRLS